MSTIIDISGGITATTNPVFPDTTAFEQSVLDIAALCTTAAWFDADDGYPDTGAPFTWYDKLGGYRATAKFPTYPPTVQATALGAKPGIVFGLAGSTSLNGQLSTQAGVELGFAGGKSYTLALIAKIPTTTTALLALLASGVESASGSDIRINSDGTIRVYHQAALQVNTTLPASGGADYRDGAPHFILVSYDFVAKELALRIDGVQKAIKVGVTTEVAVDATNQRLAIASRGATSSQSNAFVGTIGEVFSFCGIALHRSQYATQLAALEARRSAYGIA